VDAGAFIFARLASATSAGTRVYPHILPQSPTYPAVTYQQVSAVRTHAMGSTGPVVRVRMQVNLWGRTYADARTLAAETLARLGRFNEQIGSTRVLDVLLDNELDTYESETQTRRVVHDYTILLTSN